ncbi:D-isomer specific 2-hydroxyacid dehydrogenase family protein [Amycolatopsis benzoatilytica]|uniref:D-isomer specific 2-hydroxyacid dehydrogenase family protein n=1 Tax=Amycolatopsis benzoatilytica TaxID=346045 RepID=UPI00038185C7|nr:D-isomer specific 2-hydroxyacid dehydrogenase family protein [Amycolatopsis benzoatilytica]
MTGITLYGCGPDEAGLALAAAPRLGVRPTITADPISVATVELASGNRCVSVGHKTPVSNAVLRELSRVGVRYLSTRSIGYNHLDLRYAESVGLSVGNVAYSPDSVADYAVMLMLMSLRSMKSVVSRADARDYRLSELPGKELRDLTVGVVGTGRIGAAVIDRLRGFGCRILAYDLRQGTAAEYVPLDELFRRSDLVTLHAPLTADTRHLLDRQRIARLRPGAFVVNTGRGGLVDTEALLEALEADRLGGAALDVVEGEEGTFYADCRDQPDENPILARLRKLPNVLISPHTAYYTDRALRDAVENSLLNCLEFEKGMSA